MKKIQYIFSLLTIVITCSCHLNGSVSNDDGLAAFSADSLRENTAILASDSFEGRKPFTNGEKKAIRFLEEKFRAAGLEPGNGNEYLQEVPMVNIQTEAAPEMGVSSPKGNFTLKGMEDYAIWTNRTDPFISLDKTELVFAGYGVVAPEYGWNDYEGLDVKGKVVLVKVNDPGFDIHDSALFRGKAMTYYGRWMYKYEEAARQGAKGCLIIHKEDAAGYGFNVVQNNWNTSRLQPDHKDQNRQECEVIGWVNGPTAVKLLEASGLDSSVLFKADQRGFKGIPMNLQLSTTMKVKTTSDKSYNVIGKITGAVRPDETIIFTSHWDHLGIGKPDEKGDSIYNGALDNASGSAGLIEMARAFKNLKKRPDRTIVFLSVTAEEQGLCGSAYYTHHPVFPLEKTVANINTDEINPFEPNKDLLIIGSGQNELEDLLIEEAAKAYRIISPDAHPETGSYYRSDHFNFAKAGVPALYTKIGNQVIGKDPQFGEQRMLQYKKDHYHRPSDEFQSAAWPMTGAISDLKLLFQLGKRLASSNLWPKWKDGSEFKKAREKQH